MRQLPKLHVVQIASKSNFVHMLILYQVKCMYLRLTSARRHIVNDHLAKLNMCFRWVGAMEAAWRLYREPIDGLWPPVQRLGVHLDGEETILFDDQANMHQVLARDKNTTLTAWFKYNRTHDDGNRQLTYQQFPEHYKYVKKRGNRHWEKRVANRMCVGRMYMASPGMILAGARMTTQ